ncbi:MAG: glycosyltransferase [Vicinamibacterales bacterium]
MDRCDDVTVLICTWNRARLLDETLSSIAQLEPPAHLRWEVVVVDNNSSDDTRHVVERQARQFPTTLRYLFEPRQGKSWAMNTGLSATRLPLVLFADDDIRVSRGWLAAVTGAFRDDPDIAYVGGPVVPIWEQACPRWFAQTGKTLWGTLAILDYGSEPFVFEERRKVPLGANFAVRRTMIEQVGGFDPSLGRNADTVIMGQELPEFFARSRAAGFRGRYLPEMGVEHHVPAYRLRPTYVRRWWYGKGVSRARMEQRHPVTELGLDLRTVPRIAGIPRFLFGTAWHEALRWCAALAGGNVGGRIAAETQLWYVAGQVREQLRYGSRRAGPRPLPPPTTARRSNAG